MELTAIPGCVHQFLWALRYGHIHTVRLFFSGWRQAHTICFCAAIVMLFSIFFQLIFAGYFSDSLNFRVLLVAVKWWESPTSRARIAAFFFAALPLLCSTSARYLHRASFFLASLALFSDESIKFLNVTSSFIAASNWTSSITSFIMR